VSIDTRLARLEQRIVPAGCPACTVKPGQPVTIVMDIPGRPTPPACCPLCGEPVYRFTIKIDRHEDRYDEGEDA